MTQVLAPTPQNIARAAQAWRDGELVAMPTETVYGLGANAMSDQAVARIFALKNRPAINPLMIHAASMADLEPHVEFDSRARLLAQHFWPGPLAIVVQRKASSGISHLASAGLPTLAVRVPSHPVCQQLLRSFGGLIAAPSANLSGRVSPTMPEHVLADFGSKAPLIVAGGKAAIGLESTIVDASVPTLNIFRQGAVTAEQLQAVLGVPVPMYSYDNSEAPKSPGLMLKHYSPTLPMRLNAKTAHDGEALLAFGPVREAPNIFALSLTGDLEMAASNLFAMLRAADNPARFSGIAVMEIPANGIGAAINERLLKAAG